jgi:hypothetical protein
VCLCSSGNYSKLRFTVASNTEHWQDQLQFLNSNVHGFVWGAELDTGGPPHTGYRGQGVTLKMTSGSHAVVLMCRIVQQHGCCVIKRKVMKAVVDSANACMWNGGYDHAIHGAARAACKAAVQACTGNHHQLTYMQAMVLLVTLFNVKFAGGPHLFAYLAGFIDGDACISMDNGSNYTMSVCLAQSNPGYIEALCDFIKSKTPNQVHRCLPV